MIWFKSDRGDPVANVIAKRHYTCQSPDSAQFVPPGRCLVLLTKKADALWVTSYPFPEYVKHRWAGAWICSLFRKECEGIASSMIREAVAATRWRWPDIPALGMVTFIDRKKVPPIIRRGVKTWGYSYKRAGFVEVGETVGGLLALHLTPDQMPDACPPRGIPPETVQHSLEELFI